MTFIVISIGRKAILNPERGNPKEQQEKIFETCDTQGIK